MVHDLNATALLVVDVQTGFDDSYWGPGNNPDAEANIAKLIAAWRRAKRPVVFVRHDSVLPESPLRPNQPGNALKPELAGEPDLLVTKNVNSAFYGEPDLDAWLRHRGITGVAIAGITTNHCCETTARMAGNLGYETIFVLDATRAFDQVDINGETIPADEVARMTAANLHGEFADVVMTADLT
ncbi:MAG: cysteine hydrolase family protein [Acidimicrobiia bacterium]|nr:cysteine hydrolase family protein [Acidimicrobiia bacterium]